jgi:catechol 2,3-dioxygenase-like lactoylglutathione lyase family enzyme
LDTVIQSTIPVLASLDLAESASFYTERLGFEQKLFLPGQYLIVSREGAEIHFWPCKERHIAENTSCYIRTRDVDCLYREFLVARLELKPPITQTWGMRELYVIDTHGNLLKFGQGIDVLKPSIE